MESDDLKRDLPLMPPPPDSSSMKLTIRQIWFSFAAPTNVRSPSQAISRYGPRPGSSLSQTWTLFAGCCMITSACTYDVVNHTELFKGLLIPRAPLFYGQTCWSFFHTISVKVQQHHFIFEELCLLQTLSNMPLLKSCQLLPPPALRRSN